MGMSVLEGIIRPDCHPRALPVRPWAFRLSEVLMHQGDDVFPKTSRALNRAYVLKQCARPPLAKKTDQAADLSAVLECLVCHERPRCYDEGQKVINGAVDNKTRYNVSGRHNRGEDRDDNGLQDAEPAGNLAQQAGRLGHQEYSQELLVGDGRACGHEHVQDTGRACQIG